jgi:predicted DNA-binding transcriptional regulator AlpA
MSNSYDPDELLTEREVAALLKLSVRTLQSWRTRKVGPPVVRVGRSIRYRRGSLMDWLK